MGSSGVRKVALVGGERGISALSSSVSVRFGVRADGEGVGGDAADPCYEATSEA